jgi:hypothetical protein
MKFILCLALIGAVLVPFALGQQVLETPLATPLAMTEIAGAITAEDAFAYLEVDGIHSFTGLPAPVQHQFLPLVGALGPADHWLKVNESIAVYRANSGLVAIVRGLPHAPTVSTTSFMHPAGNLQRINDNTVLARDPQSSMFHVIRIGALSASLHVVASPYSLASDPGYGWGRSGDDGYMGLSAGSDQVSGTFDDQVVLLWGLSGPPSGFLVTGSSLPAGTGPRAFVMSEQGQGAYYEAVPSTLAVPLTIVTAIGNGIGFWSIGVPKPGITVLPPTPQVNLAKLPGAGFDVSMRDDISMAWSHSLIDPGNPLVALAPVIRGTYIAQGSYPLANYEVITDSGQGSTPFYLTSFAEASPRVQTIWTPEWGFPCRPSDTTFVQFWSSGPFAGQSGLTWILDPFYGASSASISLNHFPRMPVVLGKGRVAWLASTTGPTDPIDRVACLVLPNNHVLDDPATPGYVWDSWLNVTPLHPTGSDLVRIQAHPPYFDPQAPISLFVSDRVLPVPIEASTLGLGGAPLRLDLQHVWPFEIPLLGSPVREFTLPAVQLPPAFLGRPLYLQALRYDSFGPPSLSHTIFLTIG